MTEVSSKINVYPCNKHVKRIESSYWFTKLKYGQKFFLKFLTQKISITYAGVTPNGQK